MKIDWELKIDEKAIGQKIENLITDDVMIEIHNLFAKLCNDYVPMLEGPLSQHIDVTPDYVRYKEPYANYQYHGADFNFTKDFHPLATHHWDKVMVGDKGDVFLKGVQDILKRRAKQLYG